jgi:hypothetical protein
MVKKKYFVLDQLEQPRNNENLLYWHDKPNERTKTEPPSFVPIHLSFNSQQGPSLSSLSSLSVVPRKDGDSKRTNEGGPVLAMRSLPDVAHDGVLCTFSNRSAPDRGKWCGPSGKPAWTVHCTYKITPCWVTLLQPARQAAVLGRHSKSSASWVETGDTVYSYIVCYSPIKNLLQSSIFAVQ